MLPGNLADMNCQYSDTVEQRVTRVQSVNVRFEGANLGTIRAAGRKARSLFDLKSKARSSVVPMKAPPGKGMELIFT